MEVPTGYQRFHFHFILGLFWAFFTEYSFHFRLIQFQSFEVLFSLFKQKSIESIRSMVLIGIVNFIRKIELVCLSSTGKLLLPMLCSYIGFNQSERDDGRPSCNYIFQKLNLSTSTVLNMNSGSEPRCYPYDHSLQYVSSKFNLVTHLHESLCFVELYGFIDLMTLYDSLWYCAWMLCASLFIGYGPELEGCWMSIRWPLFWVTGNDLVIWRILRRIIPPSAPR